MVSLDPEEEIVPSKRPATLPRNFECQYSSKQLRSQRGQGLIEYLVIVALMGVATIAIVRVMGQTVSSRFATITYALQGQRRQVSSDRVEDTHHKKKDLGDFFEGVGDRGPGN